VLRAVVDAWQNRREAAIGQAEELTGYLQNVGGEEEGSGFRVQGSDREELKAQQAAEILRHAVAQLSRAFDSTYGGFGTAPKFPHSMDLQLLLRQWKRNPRPELLHMVTHTLDKMAAGGIYDHLAGGFARYSVDERWLVPHFEKMLYDNALLTGAYLDAIQCGPTVPVGQEAKNIVLDQAMSDWGGWTTFVRIVRETCDYILKYMTDSAGGFHSTEDADSEGEEGKFYVWTPAEIREVLGDERGRRICDVYDVTDAGNFEYGKSILNLSKTIEQIVRLRGWNAAEIEAELAESRTRLLESRDQRVRPGKDDKILVSWNGMMIDALARAGVMAGERRYIEAAGRAATFILNQMRRSDGRLLHTWRNGKAKLDTYLDDYACIVNSLVTLYECTYFEPWIDEAIQLADVMLMHFEDKSGGGFYFTADDHEQLIARNKDFHDASVPSGNGMAATALIRLGKLTGKPEYLESARRTLIAGLSVMQRQPTAAGQLLIALDMWLGPMQELVLIGGNVTALNKQCVGELRRWNFLPNSVHAYRPFPLPSDCRLADGLRGIFQDRLAVDNQPTLYICENFTCQAPVVGAEAIRAALAKLAAPSKSP
jgi:uncharacterized protein YyaL (SSP411 family)